MSGDKIASSFGEPNASSSPPAPTPSETSPLTPSIFPSPVFETPTTTQGQFDDSSSTNGEWTPRFAEEYSVFNSTPGNLRGASGPFADFGTTSTAATTPYLGASLTPEFQRKRSFVEGIAAEIATHVNHFSPNPNKPLSPVEPSRRLQSSSISVIAEFTRIFDDDYNEEQEASEKRPAKKARCDTGVLKTPKLGQEEGQGQLATPPPSARKERKLAPKLDLSKMQNMHDGQGYSQQDFMAGGQHQQFVATPTDMFGYPMSAPATAAPYSDPRAFWAVDPNMQGMDIDFNAATGDMYHTGNAQHMGSIDWTRTPQLFQNNVMAPPPNQDNMIQGSQHGQPSLVSKAVMPDEVDTETDNQGMFAGQYTAPMDDAFGIVQNDGGVNPDMLFSRPPSSSSLTATAFSQAAIQPSASAPPAAQAVQFQPPRAPDVQSSEPPKRGKLARSTSVRDMVPPKSRVSDRALASSPTKSSRPGLTRSYSDNRGKKPAARTSLPALAPAPRVQLPQPPISRALMSQPSRPPSRPPTSSRPSGRRSPVKGDNHSRLSSLSSIPESISSLPRARTQAKFTIDANGRARVETTVIVDDDLPPSFSASHRRHSIQQLPRHQRHWSTSGSEHEHDDDSDSSVDDEPIIIPSRNHSFALPDPVKPTRKNPLHVSQRSVDTNNSSSYVSFATEPLDPEDPASEAETVMNDMTPTNGKFGDAASELKKLREVRHNRPIKSPTKHKRLSLGGGQMEFATHNGQRYAILSSPSKLTDEESLPTPASSRGQAVRCLCGGREVEGFMVQCESCEMWLHGKCVNMTKRTLPSVYVCLFCANTPNMRGGRIRDNGRVSMGGAVVGASPLAHKSMRSFR